MRIVVAQLLTLTVGRCSAFAPLLEFGKLEKRVVATEDLAQAFAVLGGRAGLTIADPIHAHDDEGAARLRLEFTR